MLLGGGHLDRVLVAIGYDTATGLQPLSSGASQGVGWSLVSGGATLPASAATQLNATHIELQFPAAVPTATTTLYYSFGVGWD